MPDKLGRLPLHYICASCLCDDVDLPLIQLLVEKYQYFLQEAPNAALAKDANGNTPFLLACRNDVNLNVVHMFVRHYPMQMLGLERHPHAHQASCSTARGRNNET